jgi:hypothetical protein
VEIGSYPFFRMGRPGSSIVLRSTDAGRLASATAEVKAMMTALGDEPIELEA